MQHGRAKTAPRDEVEDAVKDHNATGMNRSIGRRTVTALVSGRDSVKTVDAVHDRHSQRQALVGPGVLKGGLLTRSIGSSLVLKGARDKE